MFKIDVKIANLRAYFVMRSLEEENPIEMKYISDLLHNNEYQPCFYNVGSYATAFLYFIETDTTIGTS